MGIIKQKKELQKKIKVKTLLVELIESGIIVYENRKYFLTDLIIQELENESKKLGNRNHEKGFWYTREGFVTVFDTLKSFRLLREARMSKQNIIKNAVQYAVRANK